MRFGVLGPVTASREDRPVPLTPMGRSLLAVLLVDANRSVSEARLAEALWGGNPPPTSKAALQNAVLKLRRAFGAPESSRVRRIYDGYLIEVPAGGLDLQEFDDLCRAGAGDSEAGRWPEAADALSRALTLWRGDPLADALPATREAVGVDRIFEARLQAGEQLSRARLALGQYDAVVIELLPLARQHPWREAIHGHLMHALHGAGRQADALNVYQELRAGLVEELGVEPSAAVADMHQRILAADPGLLVRATATATATAPAPVQSPAKARPPAVEHRLPPRPPTLIGRDAELAELTRQAFDSHAASSSGVTVLSGTAGVGKTALALTWAHQAAARFPDGRLYLDLNGFAAEGRPLSTDTAVRILLDFLGTPGDVLPATPEGRIALYRDTVAGKRLLVILDNARGAEQVRPLIPTCPACRVVVTSRHTLVGLVVHEGAGAVALTPLTAEGARDLLVQRLGTARAAEHEATIALVAERCARLPLALTIAAARVAALSEVPLDRIAEQLAGEYGGLALLDGGDPSSSVRAVISWSYQELAPDAARLFRLLALHPGPDFTVPAAAALAGTGRYATVSGLVELRAMSLVAENAPGRYSMHALLQAFARERLRADESDAERSAAHRRLMDFYAASCLAANGQIVMRPERWDSCRPAPDPRVEPETFTGADTATAWFVAESDVLRNLLAVADSAGSDVDVCRLGYAQIAYLDRSGRWRDGEEIGSLAMAAAGRRGDVPVQAHLHYQVGSFVARLGDVGGGLKHLTRSLELYESVHDAGGEAHTHQALANVCFLEGDWAGAVDHTRRYLTFSQAAGDQVGEAMAVNTIGWFTAHTDDPEAGLALCRRAAEMVVEIGRPELGMHVWDSLGFVHHRLGDFEQAGVAYQKAAGLAAGVGYDFQEAMALLRLGDVHVLRGDAASAREAWARAALLLEASGRPEAGEVRRRLAGGV